MHPMVIGELALGTISGRERFLGLLSALPGATEATHDEVLKFVAERRLHGKSLSLVDSHLLASTVLTASSRFWTRDRRLATAAADLGLAWMP